MPFCTCWRCNLCCHVALRPARFARPAALSRSPRCPVPQPFIIHICFLDYTIIHLTQTSPPLLFHPRRVHEAIFFFFRRRRTTAGSSAFFIKRGVGGAAPENFFFANFSSFPLFFFSFFLFFLSSFLAAPIFCRLPAAINFFPRAAGTMHGEPHRAPPFRSRPIFNGDVNGHLTTAWLRLCSSNVRPINRTIRPT